MTDEFSAVEGMLMSQKTKNEWIKFGSGLPPLGTILGKLTADRQQKRIDLCREGLECVRKGREQERPSPARDDLLRQAHSKLEAAVYVQ